MITDQDDDFIVLDYNQDQLKQLEQTYLNQTKTFLQKTQAFRIQNWYPILQEFTFKSIFFQLTAFEAYALYVIYYDNKDQQLPQVKQSIEHLQKKINHIISNSFQDGCFAKLSTRSPKDYSWDFRNKEVFEEATSQLSKILLNHNFDKIPKRKLRLEEWNVVYQNLLEIPKNRLKINNGKKLIQMFSHSERIVIDINQLQTAQGYLFRQFSNKDYSRKDLGLIKVCLREWQDFKWETEFRCFYNNYALNAITPYVQDAVYKIDEEQIKDKVTQFFKEITPKLQQTGLSQGVMDICIVNGLVRLIQINTFDQNSRPSLFNWKQDRQILENGPLTMRTLKEPTQNILLKLPSLMGMVDKGSQKVVRKAIARVNPLIDLSDIKE